jgi:CBS domain-containing protein
MKKANCHHLPVLDGGELKGIISDRDIRMAPVSEHKTRTVESMCIEEVVSVDADTSVAVAAAIMAEKHISSIIVTDQGKMAGIFTTTDACRALATLLGPTA